MSIDLLLTGLMQGLILAFVAYAVMIPFRLLDVPDLSAEGAYPLGGVVCASALLAGVHPLLAVMLGAITAGFMGMATCLVYLKLKVNSLLAGIILSTMSYSVCLRIMGKPNVSLFHLSSLFSSTSTFSNILMLLMILAALIIPLGFFLKTEFGLIFRAIGYNPDFSKRQGFRVERYTLLGFFIAGSLSGLAGGLMVQIQSYMDIGMGLGIVIHGLAALMIGESITGNKTLNRQLLAPLVGALLYQQIQGLALSLGLAPSDLKLFTGIIVLMVIATKVRGRHALT